MNIDTHATDSSEQMLLEGYLESRAGQGTVVARHLPTLLLDVRADGFLKQRTDAKKDSATHLAWRVLSLKDIPFPVMGMRLEKGSFSKVKYSFYT